MNNKQVDLVLRYYRKASRIIRYQGLSALIHKLKDKLNRNRQNRRFYAMNHVTPEQLADQRKVLFQHSPQISLLVPLFNTPEVFLRELIESVQNQSYANWQLCFADGSTQPGNAVEQLVMTYARADKRLSYVRLRENRGISGNTNACLGLATGAYIGLFDHDDLLAPNALFEVVAAINRTGADFLYTDELCFEKTPDKVTHIHFKPDFAIDNLRSNNYICHFSIFTKALIDNVGEFDDRFNGSQDYDIILRLTEQANKIHHIAQVLYYWRVHSASVASDLSAKPYAITAARNALQSHLDRVGIKGSVQDSIMLSTYKINYEIDGQPLISILIQNSGPADSVKRCVDSIRERSTYSNFEIVVIDTGTGQDLPARYAALLRQNPRMKVLYHSALAPILEVLNTVIGDSSCAYVVLLDNNLEVLKPSWLEEMLMFAQRANVGAVGAKIISRNKTIQHAGIGLGLLSLFGYYFRGYDSKDSGYVSRLTYAQDVSAVSGSCLMTARSKFMAVGGFDTTFSRSLFDVDYCLKARNDGYLVVFTPYAELFNYEQGARQLANNQVCRPDNRTDVLRFRSKWQAIIAAGDPYYNANLSLTREDFSIKLQ